MSKRGNGYGSETRVNILNLLRFVSTPTRFRYIYELC